MIVTSFGMICVSTVIMANSAMDMLAHRARGLQWKIFMRRELMVLMAKSLAFLEFSMVYFHLSLISISWLYTDPKILATELMQCSYSYKYLLLICYFSGYYFSRILRN